MLDSKHVVITGGGSGFGKAMALKFAREGWEVLISGRTESKLAAVQEEAEKEGLPGSVARAVADMTSMQAVQGMVEEAMSRWGRIDVLINNAGAGVKIAPFDTFADEEIRQVMDQNLYTALNGCQAVIPVMKKQQSGTIINVSSVCAKHAWPEWSVYTAAKMGLLGFTRCLYGELRPFGIKVGSLIPGAAPTDFARNANIPFQLEGESMKAEDVAEAAFLMASLPARATIEEMVVWGTNQEVNPL